LSSSFNGRNFAQNRRHFQRSEKKKTTTQIKANIEDYDIVPKSGGKAKGGFVGGLLIGGAIFGALGFLFAPQLSKHILKGKKVLDDLLEEEEEEEEENWTEEKETNATSSSSIKLEKRAEKELEETRKSLNQKIAELNKAIDEFSDEADVRLNAKLGRLSEELDSAEARSF
jgi:gas vesicle protein